MPGQTTLNDPEFTSNGTIDPDENTHIGAPTQKSIQTLTDLHEALCSDNLVSGVRHCVPVATRKTNGPLMDETGKIIYTVMYDTPCAREAKQRREEIHERVDIPQTVTWEESEYDVVVRTGSVQIGTHRAERVAVYDVEEVDSDEGMRRLSEAVQGL